MGSALLYFGKIWMNLTGLFQGNSYLYLLILCSVRRRKESGLFLGWSRVSLQCRIANITVLKFLLLWRGKIKIVTPRIASVSGADTAWICLVLRLFAQIDGVLWTILSLPAIAFRHPYFSCPGESSFNIHRYKFYMYCGGGYHLYPFLSDLTQLSLVALKAFFKFASLCVCASEASLDKAKHWSCRHFKYRYNSA